MALLAKHAFVVGWGDCAPSGAVYYPNYFRWFDQSTWRLFEINGISIEVLEKKYEVVGMPLIELNCQFVGGCRLHDRVTLESGFVELKEKDFVIEHVLSKSGRILVRSRDIRFWSQRKEDKLGLRRVPIPNEIVQLLGDKLDRPRIFE